MPHNNPNNQTAEETTQLQTQLTRIGMAIDMEVTLISERMSWLVMSESFFFSAFKVSLPTAKNKDLRQVGSTIRLCEMFAEAEWCGAARSAPHCGKMP